MQINLEHNNRAHELLSKAKEHGVALDGDCTAGTFTHPLGVEGTYCVNDMHLVLVITRKPRLLPERVIEAALNRALGQCLKAKNSAGAC